VRKAAPDNGSAPVRRAPSTNWAHERIGGCADSVRVPPAMILPSGNKIHVVDDLHGFVNVVGHTTDVVPSASFSRPYQLPDDP